VFRPHLSAFRTLDALDGRANELYNIIPISPKCRFGGAYEMYLSVVGGNTVTSPVSFILVNLVINIINAVR